MKTNFIKSFEVRWSDIDANMHLIHTAYSGYMAHTRMCYLADHGIDMTALNDAGLGPVLLNEHIHFIKEVRPHESVYVDISLSGMDKQYRIFQFDQGLYKSDGRIAAFSRLMIGFISMQERKLAAIPPKWIDPIEQLPKTHDFKWLDKTDMRWDYVDYKKKLDLPKNN